MPTCPGFRIRATVDSYGPWCITTPWIQRINPTVGDYVFGVGFPALIDFLQQSGTYQVFFDLYNGYPSCWAEDCPCTCDPDTLTKLIEVENYGCGDIYVNGTVVHSGETWTHDDIDFGACVSGVEQNSSCLWPYGGMPLGVHGSLGCSGPYSGGTQIEIIVGNCPP
jgi:hypothetical protein